jgi:transcriptional regulator with XRE-family HTH domain
MSTSSATEFYSKLGKQIRELRLRAGLSQAALGAHLGRSASAIDRYEMGQRRIALAELVRVADVLGVEPETLVHAATGRGRPGARVSKHPPGDLRAEHLRLLRALDRRLASPPADGREDAVAEEPARYGGQSRRFPLPPRRAAASLRNARLLRWARQAGLPPTVGVAVLRRYATLVLEGVHVSPRHRGRK